MIMAVSSPLSEGMGILKIDENEVDHSNAVCDGNASISADGDERQYHVGQSDEYG